MRINADRLHESLRQLAQIGATPGGGVTRLALSPRTAPRAISSAAGWRRPGCASASTTSAT